MRVGFTFHDAKLRAMLKRLEDDLPDLFKRIGRVAFTRLAASSTSVYMRDAKGEGRRSLYDRGQLRIVSGRLARSLADGRSRESVRSIEVDGRGAEVTFGTRTPYARIHEQGGTTGRGGSVTIAARPYLEPALRDETPEITERAQRLFTKYIFARL